MLTEKFCFVHIPRMGGSAFKSLCSAHISPILGNTGHMTGAELGWLDVPRVALLRDPWNWYRSVSTNADMVGDSISPTYAGTVRRYLLYPDGDGTSRAVRAAHVYCWDGSGEGSGDDSGSGWSSAVRRLLRDFGHDPDHFAPLDAHRGLRATPPGAPPPALIPSPTSLDLAIWRAAHCP